ARDSGDPDGPELEPLVELPARVGVLPPGVREWLAGHDRAVIRVVAEQFLAAHPEVRKSLREQGIRHLNELSIAGPTGDLTLAGLVRTVLARLADDRENGDARTTVEGLLEQPARAVVSVFGRTPVQVDLAEPGRLPSAEQMLVVLRSAVVLRSWLPGLVHLVEQLEFRRGVLPPGGLHELPDGDLIRLARTEIQQAMDPQKPATTGIAEAIRRQASNNKVMALLRSALGPNVLRAPDALKVREYLNSEESLHSSQRYTLARLGQNLARIRSRAQLNASESVPIDIAREAERLGDLALGMERGNVDGRMVWRLVQWNLQDALLAAEQEDMDSLHTLNQSLNPDLSLQQLIGDDEQVREGVQKELDLVRAGLDNPDVEMLKFLVDALSETAVRSSLAPVTAPHGFTADVHDGAEGIVLLVRPQVVFVRGDAKVTRSDEQTLADRVRKLVKSAWDSTDGGVTDSRRVFVRVVPEIGSLKERTPDVVFVLQRGTETVQPIHVGIQRHLSTLPPTVLLEPLSVGATDREILNAFRPVLGLPNRSMVGGAHSSVDDDVRQIARLVLDQMSVNDASGRWRPGREADWYGLRAEDLESLRHQMLLKLWLRRIRLGVDGLVPNSVTGGNWSGVQGMVRALEPAHIRSMVAEAAATGNENVERVVRLQAQDAPDDFVLVSVGVHMSQGQPPGIVVVVGQRRDPTPPVQQASSGRQFEVHLEEPPPRPSTSDRQRAALLALRANAARMTEADGRPVTLPEDEVLEAILDQVRTSRPPAATLTQLSWHVLDVIAKGGPGLGHSHSDSDSDGDSHSDSDEPVNVADEEDDWGSRPADVAGWVPSVENYQDYWNFTAEDKYAVAVLLQEDLGQLVLDAESSGESASESGNSSEAEMEADEGAASVDDLVAQQMDPYSSAGQAGLRRSPLSGLWVGQEWIGPGHRLLNMPSVRPLAEDGRVRHFESTEELTQYVRGQLDHVISVDAEGGRDVFLRFPRHGMIALGETHTDELTGWAVFARMLANYDVRTHGVPTFVHEEIPYDISSGFPQLQGMYEQDLTARFGELGLAVPDDWRPFALSSGFATLGQIIADLRIQLDDPARIAANHPYDLEIWRVKLLYQWGYALDVSTRGPGVDERISDSEQHLIAVYHHNYPILAPFVDHVNKGSLVEAFEAVRRENGDAYYGNVFLNALRDFVDAVIDALIDRVQLDPRLNSAEQNAVLAQRNHGDHNFGLFSDWREFAMINSLKRAIGTRRRFAFAGSSHLAVWADRPDLQAVHVFNLSPEGRDRQVFRAGTDGLRQRAVAAAEAVRSIYQQLAPSSGAQDGQIATTQHESHAGAGAGVWVDGKKLTPEHAAWGVAQAEGWLSDGLERRFESVRELHAY
ncbi:hypothetical protein KIH74_35570, partial [Kineosporia sp. J2-2]